jgi:hypothetical protein
MKGRRFYILALFLVAMLLLPYSGLSLHRDSQHRPYDDLQERVPQALFDSDGDLLRDGDELFYGTDPKDVDTDDDLCPDGVEVERWLALVADVGPFEKDIRQPLGDADGDNVPNIRDPDSDNDGLLDGWEFENLLDPADPHTYPALLPDRFQYYPFFLGDLRDIDDDGMPDDWELAVGVEEPYGDDDGDGVLNVDEYLNGTDPLGRDELYGWTPTKPDSDGDGVVDELERALGLDPNRADSDGDSLMDGREIYEFKSSPFVQDTDGDLMDDGTEVNIGSSPIMRDTDGDGIPDPAETTTDPTIPDTDKDLIPDAEDVGAVVDSDGDGIPDAIEILSQYANGPTDPEDPDSDGDGLLDGQEDSNRNGRREGNDPTDANSDWRRGGETDPTDSDTDGGGMRDRDELWFGRDPLTPGDDRIDIDPPNPPDPIIEPPPPADPIDLRGIGRILLIILIIMFAIVILTMLYNTATTQEDFLEEVLEALEEGERVLYSITLTDDVREAIFQAYKRFLRVMDAYGYSKGEPTTAREFATQVRKALATRGTSLGEFTVIFEMARYSDHTLHLGHRDRAQAAFASLREEVSTTLGRPDKPIEEEGDETSGGLLRRLLRKRGRA